MNSHTDVDGDCPLAIVPCRYCDIGCKFKVYVLNWEPQVKLLWVMGILTEFLWNQFLDFYVNCRHDGTNLSSIWKISSRLILIWLTCALENWKLGRSKFALEVAFCGKYQTTINFANNLLRGRKKKNYAVHRFTRENMATNYVLKPS